MVRFWQQYCCFVSPDSNIFRLKQSTVLLIHAYEKIRNKKIFYVFSKLSFEEKEAYMYLFSSLPSRVPTGGANSVAIGDIYKILGGIFSYYHMKNDL